MYISLFTGRVTVPKQRLRLATSSLYLSFSVCVWSVYREMYGLAISLGIVTVGSRIERSPALFFFSFCACVSGVVVCVHALFMVLFTVQLYLSQILNLLRETSFGERIADIRRDELKTLMKSAYLKAVSLTFWSTTPLLVSVVTFSVYTLLGNDVLPPSLEFS